MNLTRVDVPRLLEQLGIGAERNGAELWAACPLPGHNEEKPSWSIRDDAGEERNGLWHCFGCGESGNAAALVMHAVDLSGYGAALDWLRERGHDLEGRGRKLAGARVVIELARGALGLEMPYGVDFHDSYERWVGPARDYMQRLRRVPEWQVKRWGIGYAAVGVLAGRIVIPLRDRAGLLLNYHARTFAGQDPRYRYPSSDDGPDLDAVWGEQHWPVGRTLDSVARLVVCEGAFDALAAERAICREGWTAAWVAAIGGSSLRPAQLAKLGFFSHILVATDNDAAGDRAARDLRNALGSTRKLKRVIFPKGMDAAAMETEDLARLLIG